MKTIEEIKNNMVNVGEQAGFDLKDILEIFGARAGQGRTTYCVSRVANELEENKSVLFFSPEDNVNSILNKFKIIEKENSLEKGALKIYDGYELGLEYVVKKMEELSNSDEGLDFVVIDGLQLLIGSNGQSDRSQELSFATYLLEDIGEILGCKILVTIQLMKTSYEQS